MRDSESASCSKKRYRQDSQDFDNKFVRQQYIFKQLFKKLQGPFTMGNHTWGIQSVSTNQSIYGNDLRQWEQRNSKQHVRQNQVDGKPSTKQIADNNAQHYQAFKTAYKSVRAKISGTTTDYSGSSSSQSNSYSGSSDASSKDALSYTNYIFNDQQHIVGGLQPFGQVQAEAKYGRLSDGLVYQGYNQYQDVELQRPQQKQRIQNGIYNLVSSNECANNQQLHHSNRTQNAAENLPSDQKLVQTLLQSLISNGQTQIHDCVQHTGSTDDIHTQQQDVQEYLASLVYGQDTADGQQYQLQALKDKLSVMQESNHPSVQYSTGTDSTGSISHARYQPVSAAPQEKYSDNTCYTQLSHQSLPAQGQQFQQPQLMRSFSCIESSLSSVQRYKQYPLSDDELTRLLHKLCDHLKIKNYDDVMKCSKQVWYMVCCAVYNQLHMLMSFDYDQALLQNMVAVACFWIGAKQFECRRNIPSAKQLARTVYLDVQNLAMLELSILEAIDWQVLGEDSRLNSKPMNTSTPEWYQKTTYI